MQRSLPNLPALSSLLTPAILILSLCSGAHAATNGTDNANQAAYELDDSTANDGNPANNTNNWVTSDNGAATGAAFLPWTLSTPGSSGIAGFFIGDSRNLSGGAGADINVGLESFGMYGAGSDKAAEAVRLFSSALEVGQTFSIDLGVNFRNGFKGIDLRDGSSSAIFNFNVGSFAGTDDYRVQFAASGNGSIGNAYSNNSAFHLSFTQTSLTGGTWSILRSGGETDFDTGTYNGIAAGFKLYVGNTGGGSESDMFANNLSIVPEPGSAITAVLGGIALLSLRRRKHG